LLQSLAHRRRQGLRMRVAFAIATEFASHRDRAYRWAFYFAIGRAKKNSIDERRFGHPTRDRGCAHFKTLRFGAGGNSASYLVFKRVAQPFEGDGLLVHRFDDLARERYILESGPTGLVDDSKEVGRFGVCPLANECKIFLQLRNLLLQFFRVDGWLRFHTWNSF
jgi:hypothetical protein